MMLADLPPSSKETFFTFSAATCMTACRPLSTGEGDGINQRVRGDGLAHDRADPRHQVEDARWEADLVDDLGEAKALSGATRRASARPCSPQPGQAPP